MANDFKTGAASRSSMAEFNAKVAKLLEGRSDVPKPESTRRNASRRPMRQARPEAEDRQEEEREDAPEKEEGGDEVQEVA